MFFFRLRDRLKHEHVEEYLHQLINNENKFTREDVEKFQKDKLKELLLYVCEHVPYYKNLNIYPALLEAEYSSPYELLSYFPIIDKKTITDNNQQWISDQLNINNISWVRTSGSTGTPFCFFINPIAAEYKAASKYRLYDRFGVKPDEKQICLSCDKSDEKMPVSLKIKTILNNRFFDKRFYSNVTYLTDEEKLKQIEEIKRRKVATIWGYPSAIYELSKWALANKVTINDGRIKAVIFSGEGHTEMMKQTVSNAMGGIPVIDEYNSSESFLAGSCRSSNLHLNEDTTIFEVLTPDGIKEYGRGELLVTSLYNKDFPIIRYKIGDIVEITNERCHCGSPFKLLKAVDGRSSVVIYNGSSVMPHTTLSHYIHYSEFEKYINRIQIEQFEKGSVIVRVQQENTGLDKNKFESMWKSIFNEIYVEFEYVNDIPREKSGKFRDVIQNIK